MILFNKTVAGSHLYGTNIEGSDEDFKEITLPSAKQVLLGKADEALVTTSAELDTTQWSFQKWVRLVGKMDSNAYEILFAPIVEQNEEFRSFLPNPKLVLHDNRDSAIGFAKSQAIRYGARGERLEAFIKVYELCLTCATIPEVYAHAKKIKGVTKEKGPDGVELLSVYGKRIPFPASIGEARAIYKKVVDGASHRAVNAIGSHDWKGIMHALRIAGQMSELVETGEVKFPLKNRELLLDIRNGKLSHGEAMDMVDAEIDRLVNLPPSVHFGSRNTAIEYGEGLVCLLHRTIVCS